MPAIDTIPGGPWGSKDPGETLECELFGPRCDHSVLEQPGAKKLSKSAEIYKKCLVLCGFWVSVPLKLHGRI